MFIYTERFIFSKRTSTEHAEDVTVSQKEANI